MTGGARGEDFWKKEKGRGRLGRLGPKGVGGARLGRQAAHGGKGRGGGWAENGEGGGEEKEKVFFF